MSDAFNDDVLASSAANAWEVIVGEIDSTESWLNDPDVKVTRTAMLQRLRELGSVVLREMLTTVEDSDIRLEEVREESEEYIGSEHDRVGLRERYEVALRVLEDAKVYESDLLNVARHVDPIDVLKRQRFHK